MDVDVLCITEHFMELGQEKYLDLDNYALASCYSRTCARRGGACILVKNNIEWKEIEEIRKMSISNVFECCAVEIAAYNILIVCIYRIPKQNNLNTFLSKINSILMCYNKLKFSNIVMAGDFNVDMLKTNTITMELEYLLLSYNLKLAIKQPTRLASQTCIDNIAHDFKSRCRAEVLEFGLSDHMSQIINIPVHNKIKLQFWRKEIRDYNNENIHKFKMCIKNFSFSEMYSMTNPSLAYKYFLEHFKLFYDLCFPTKCITIQIFSKPKWISRGIKLCSRNKRKLLWDLRTKPNIQNKIKYEQYSRQLKKVIALTKKAQNNHFIQTSDNKSKATWHLINKTRLNLPVHSISKIKTGLNEYVTNPTDIANIFNNYFVDKVKPLPDIDKNKNKRICINRTSINSMFLGPSSSLGIYKIIKNLKNTNSVGFDGISTKVIKSVNEEICSHLSYLINLSIITGEYPNDLKKTIIKPLFKKENRESLDHYRPIALIPIFSKIFEKYLYGEIYSYLEKKIFFVMNKKVFVRIRILIWQYMIF